MLGAVVESGVDFERRIAEIYQTCRHTDDIHSAFTSIDLPACERQMTAAERYAAEAA